MSIFTMRERILSLAHEYWKSHEYATTEEVIDHLRAALGLDDSGDAQALRAILRAGRAGEVDAEPGYDDVVEQSFPASDPPPSP